MTAVTADVTADVTPDPHGPIHATCVLLDAGGVLIAGRSGSGKSDLALRLIDRGATLVSDDYTCVRHTGTTLIGSAPARIAGLIEVRGIGILTMPYQASAAIRLVVDLDLPVDRFPEGSTSTIAGIDLPLIAVAPFEPSAPVKIELALAQLGAAA